MISPSSTRGVQHSAQQPVRLSGGDRADAGVEQLLTPATDPARVNSPTVTVAEVRRDVAAEQTAVDHDRLGTQARTFLDPGCGVVGTQDLARVRVDPVAFEDLGFFEREPVLSLEPWWRTCRQPDGPRRQDRDSGPETGPREDGGSCRTGGGGPCCWPSARPPQTPTSTSTRTTSDAERRVHPPRPCWPDVGPDGPAGIRTYRPT